MAPCSRRCNRICIPLDGPVRGLKLHAFRRLFLHRLQGVLVQVDVLDARLRDHPPMMGTGERIGGLKTIMGFLVLTSVVPLCVKKSDMKIMAPAQSAPISAQISENVL